MASKPLHVGLIGAGTNTRDRHIPGLRAISEVTIETVCNSSPASSRLVAEKFGIPRTAEQWRQVAEDPGIDAVVIGTWPNLHSEITLAALAAGKHVLTEARMAANLADAERMLAASRKHPRLVAQVVPGPGSLDFDETIRRMLQDGSLGRLREICVTHTSSTYADEQKGMTPRQDARQSGINTLALGIYYEIVRRWIDSDPAMISADGAIFTPARPDAGGKSVPVGVPESITVLARYAEGFRLVAHFSGIERGLPRNEIRLHGSQGSLRLDLSAQELWLAKGDAPETLVVVPPELRRGWRVEEDFVASIRTGTPVRLTDFAAGVAYMRFTDAARRSVDEFSARATRV